jgi:hypothetical protein
MRRLGLLAIVMLTAAACAACSSSDDKASPRQPGSTLASATTTVPATVAAATPSSAPNVSVPPPTSAPPSTLAPPTRAVSLGLVDIRIPQSWKDGVIQSGPGSPFGAFGPTIHVKKGYAIARLNIAAYDGSIDDLAPKYCSQTGQSAPALTPSSVRLLESGFAPVGDRTAEYRRWTAICPNGPEEHRAWLLPVSKVVFWEACSTDIIGTIVTNAVIHDSPPAQPIGPPPPSGVPQNCDDTYTTDITTGP